MSPYLPPVFRGKIPTTSGRLLAAAGVMFLLDFPLIAFFGAGGILFLLAQVVVMVVVLLLSARRWIATVLLGLVTLGAWVAFGIPGSGTELTLAAFLLVPLWGGTFIAYPRPRRRWVYVEEEVNRGE